MNLHATTASMIEEDCRILLDRAFNGKLMCAFGEDGYGQHGRHERAAWYTCRKVVTTIDVDDEDMPSIIHCIVSIGLDGYDSTKMGHIATDLNFEICYKKLLREAQIDPECLSFSPIDYQGENYVTMDINVGVLLDWV